jgi:hypothetical protein
VSAVPLRPFPTIRVPDIAAGMGERKVVTISATLASRAPIRRQPTPASIAAATKAIAARKAAPRMTFTPARPATGTLAVAPKPQPTTPAPARPAARTFATAPKAQPVRTAAVTTTEAPPQKLVSLAAAEVAPPAVLPVLRPVVSCAPDEQRIQNYAVRIVQGLGLRPNDDLRLFEEDGRPLPNLARVMLAMSSVELGALRASAHLVEGAIARAALRVQQAAADVSKPDASVAPTPPI